MIHHLSTNHRSSPLRITRGQSGVTLIELMIVVVVIGILTAIAYPSYNRYVIRSKRVAAKSALLLVADRQEQFMGNNKRYAASLTELGFAADSLAIDDNGESVTAGASDHIYTLTISDSSAITFTVEAAPQGAQAAGDTDCGTLSLNHAGARGQTGSADNCW